MTTIGDALFTKTQQRVLGLLYGKPDQSFYLNDIVRRADMGRGTIRRELDRLVSADLLRATREGNQLHFQANSECPVYHELLGMVRKTFGVAEVIRSALASVIAQIELAFIYGSMAKGEETASSDVDLLVIAESLSYADLMTALSQSEQVLGRKINPSIYTKAQFKQKRKENSSFVMRIVEQDKIWIKGIEDDIRKAG